MSLNQSTQLQNHPQHSIKMPLFHDPEFLNLGKKAKKPAEIVIHLWLDSKNLMFTSKGQTRRQIIGFRNPETGLFDTNLKNGEPDDKIPYLDFRKLASQYASQAIENKITQLKELRDKDANKYSDKYKPIDKISNELNAFMQRKVDFYTNLQKEVDLLVQTPLPHVNEFLLFKDDNLLTNGYYTRRVPYLNPIYQTLTDEQRNIVDKFLDVFADNYNKRVIAWYFGAILSNVKLQDDRVSKVLVVSSSGGGSGKSTLFEALANGLLTSSYRVIDSSFDKHFRANDKFNTSDLPTCRLGIYSEAYFNSDTDNESGHDFNGLDESEMKSWITDGYVSNEQKYADKQISQLTGLQIILTNHPPVIDKSRTDLSRRFLGAIIKPSRMAVEKATALNLYTAKAVTKYVEKNAQAFANYCVDMFQNNPTMYQNVDYNTDDMKNDLSESEDIYAENNDINRKKLKTLEPVAILKHLLNKHHLSNQDWLTEVQQAKDDNNEHVRWTDDYVYIDSSKQYFSQHKVLELREVLIDLYGNPTKKYHKRMLKLPIPKN